MCKCMMFIGVYILCILYYKTLSFIYIVKTKVHIYNSILNPANLFPLLEIHSQLGRKLGYSYPRSIYLLHFTYLLGVTVFSSSSSRSSWPEPVGSLLRLPLASQCSLPFPAFLVAPPLPQVPCVLGFWACWPVPSSDSSPPYPTQVLTYCINSSMLEASSYSFLREIMYFLFVY